MQGKRAAAMRRWFAQVIDNENDESVRFNWCSDKAAGQRMLEYWRSQLEARLAA